MEDRNITIHSAYISRRTSLMGIIRIHLMIYFLQCVCYKTHTPEGYYVFE